MHRPGISVCTHIMLTLVLVITPGALGQPGTPAIDEWARETIDLPPGFAPDMPSGVEELRFPPGWRDPASDNFWSYAIVMFLDEPAPTVARLKTLTDIYYTGLMDAFGVGVQPDAHPNSVHVEFEQVAGGRYRGTMRLVDGFATFKPITVSIRAQVLSRSGTESTIELRASPQPDEHRVWGELQSAVEHIHSKRRDQPLAALAHLPQGEWRTVLANGSTQRDIWTWGPGRYSITSITTNSESTSESVFGSFRLIYRHPVRDELAVIALSGAELIQTGTLTLHEGSGFGFEMLLHYDQDEIPWAPEPTRKISSVWSFDSPVRYTNRWTEDQGQPVDPEMTGWVYNRHKTLTPLPANAAWPPEQAGQLQALLPYIESEWQSDSARTSFRWIPYNEAVLIRKIDTDLGDVVAETVLYPHPHSKLIHARTIHVSGMVDEGIAHFEDGAIRIRAERASRDETVQIEQRLERPDAATMRLRTWLIEDGGPTLLADSMHEAVDE